MIEIKKLSGTNDPVDPYFVIASDGVKYRKKIKNNPMMLLADVFFSKLARIIGCNAVENELVDFERDLLPYEDSSQTKKTKKMVLSKNFLKKNEIVSNLGRLFGLKKGLIDIYFSDKENILQDINLKNFFNIYMVGMPESFKNAFINEWWLRMYFRDADQYCAKNVGIIYKNSFRYRQEATFSPAYDFEYCMLSDPEKMELESFAKQYIRIMNHGLHYKNVDFLKNEYRDQSEKFLSSIESIKNNSEFDDLCKFSHLAPFFVEITPCFDYKNNHSITEHKKILTKKLTEVSGDVRNNCLKRSELLLSQWR